MKILFVVKDIDFIDPIGLMLLSAMARSKDHTTSLGILARESVLNKINQLKPDIVAYSASTGEHKYYFEFNKRLKSKYSDIVTIMGGAHTTFYPECIKETNLDAICVGEGEKAFLEILERLKEGKDISEVKNILTQKNESLELNPLYENLDELPFPDRELFYKSTEMGRFPLKSFIASRGCPYRCTYCFNHAFRKLYKGKGTLLRRHSVDYMINQILEVKDRYKLEFVKFYDDIFIYRVDEWLEEFAQKYSEKVKLPFHCLTRADLVTEEMIKILKDAGCFSISMSIEAGNKDLRNNILKRSMGNEEILHAFELCYKYNIHTFSNNILGLPHSRIEDDIATLDLNIKCRVSFAEFPIFHPYPGTELGDLCIKEDLYNKRYENLHMSYMNKSPLSSFTEKEKKIQKNLSELGLVAIIFPRLRNLIVNRLIYLHHNRFFFLSYYLVKAYLIKKKIYPFRMGVRDLWEQFLKSIRLERFKHTDEFSKWK